MKAITLPLSGAKFSPVLHEHVVRVEGTSQNREFVCQHCGMRWMESVSCSTQVIDTDSLRGNIGDYYPGYKLCSEIFGKGENKND